MFSTGYIRTLTFYFSFQRLTSSGNSFTPPPWLSLGCIMGAVCVLIKAQNNMICSSWHGGSNVCDPHKDVAQCEFFNTISLYSCLVANECGFALMVLQFPPTVLKHALWVDCELLIVPRCECESEYFAGLVSGMPPTLPDYSD